MVEYEQVTGELQKQKESLRDRITQRKTHLTELCSTSYILNSDFVNLQDTKERVRVTDCECEYVIVL